MNTILLDNVVLVVWGISVVAFVVTAVVIGWRKVKSLKIK